MKRTILATAAAAAAALLPAMAGASAPSGPLRPDQTQFRELYKELVETNTTLSSGSCTLAAERMGARLSAAGYSGADLQFYAEEGHPKEGGLVAMLPGSDPKAKPILLLAHIDVVEAKREDWTRDPFTLVEEDGYFWARGSIDDKAQAAIWTDTLIRLKKEGYRPKRTIKMALTCGEETNGAFNGAQYLSTQRRALIDAEFALNEGGAGILSMDGRRIIHNVQAGEKTSQNYKLEVTNPGGHSSIPKPDNAIYRLAGALRKIETHVFPIQTSDVTRNYFAKLSTITGGETGAAMAAFAKNPDDTAASAKLIAIPNYNSVMHTTCVATLLSAGHATNALPQRATANINCRLWPGVTTEQGRADLEAIIRDPQVKVTVPEVRGPPAVAPPMTRAILEPIERLSAKRFPGVPVLPSLTAGATDGQFMGNVGIPTYGVSGLFIEPSTAGTHGLNERVGVQELYDSRDFLFDLVRAYAPQ